jgi:hypothetical protein
MVPTRPVLVQEQDRFTTRTHPGPKARRLYLHERDQAVNLWFPRGQACQDAAQSQGVLAKGRPDPVLPRRGRVPLVEDEVQDRQHRRQPFGPFGPAGNLEGDPGLGQRPFGTDDPLGDCGFGHEERPGNLLGRQASQKAQGQRHSALGPQDGVAGDEDQAQEIVANVVIHVLAEFLPSPFPALIQCAAQLIVLSLQHRLAS